MKRKFLFITLIASIGFSVITKAQTKEGTETKYRRSSLHTMIVESEKFPKKDTVIKAFYNAPFPDKYNDHSIGEKSFDPAKYPLTAEEKAEIYKPSKVGAFASEATNIKVDSANKELAVKIQKYFDQNKIANQLVAKWFDRQADGSFGYDLIAERGIFDASYLENKTAQASNEGVALLKTAGFELIPNTFVVVSRFNFVPNEIYASVIRDEAYAAANKLSVPMAVDAAKKAADELYKVTREGYSVWTTSFLYKLVWNDSIANIFYSTLYMDKNSLDPAKKEAFDKSDLFKLEFIGDEKASASVSYSAKAGLRSDEKVIEIATVRSIDAVYAKLQKKYDVFKPKTPLYTGDPITAKIGMKEGLEGGEKFEVLEQTIDPKTGVAKYVSKGTITVDEKLIWDNRYTAGEEPEVLLNEDGTPKPILDRTTFKGGKKFYSGMLIKLVK
jgi:hypothetical protein